MRRKAETGRRGKSNQQKTCGRHSGHLRDDLTGLRRTGAVSTTIGKRRPTRRRGVRGARGASRVRFYSVHRQRFDQRRGQSQRPDDANAIWRHREEVSDECQADDPTLALGLRRIIEARKCGGHLSATLYGLRASPGHWPAGCTAAESSCILEGREFPNPNGHQARLSLRIRH
jgi:hypothetical protein